MKKYKICIRAGSTSLLYDIYVKGRLWGWNWIAGEYSLENAVVHVKRNANPPIYFDENGKEIEEKNI